MVVLSCFINPLDIVKIQDVEKETKEAMCVCVGGGDASAQHCKGTNCQTHTIVNALMKENKKVLEESQKNCECVDLLIGYKINQFLF